MLGTSKGTPGDAKCLTEIHREDKNKEVKGTKFAFLFQGKISTLNRLNSGTIYHQFTSA